MHKGSARGSESNVVMNPKIGRKKENFSTVLEQPTGQNAETRVLLIVQKEALRQRYLDALAVSGVRVFVTSSFFQLSEEIGSQTYHGLLIDLLTKMKAIKENRAEVYRLAEQFPVAHLKIDPRTGEIRCFYVGRVSGSTLIDFIGTQCLNREPRRIRSASRKELHLPVLIYRSSESKRSERTFTKDITPNGCFIISTRRRKEGDEVILRFPDLNDTAFIKAQIQTVVKWGKGRQMPGIGVIFRDMSPSQAAEFSGMSG